MATGKLLNRITSGSWLVRDLIEIDETRRLIYFTGGGREGGNPYYRHLYRVSFDGTGLTLLSPEAADAMLTGEGNAILALDGGAGYALSPPILSVRHLFCAPAAVMIGQKYQLVAP